MTSKKHQQVLYIDRPVSGYYGVRDTESKPTTIRKFFQCYPELVKKVEEIRNEPDKARRLKLKQNLYCITPSGLFSGRRAITNLKSFSGIICLDFDLIPNITDAKNQICNLPFVLFCGLSVSGSGLFALIPIQHPEKHKAHFSSLQWYFKKFGYEVDPACSDITRLRFYSCDPEFFYREHPQVYTGIVEPTPAASKPQKNYPCNGSEIELILKTIEKHAVDVTSDYRDWLSIGYVIASNFGEAGRSYFHRISRFHPQYNKPETDKQFSACLRSGKSCGMNMIFAVMKSKNVKTKQ